ERQFAVLHQQQSRSRQELLAHRTDAVTHLRPRRRNGIQPCFSVGFHISDLAAAHHGYRSTRRGCIGQSLFDGLVKLGGGGRGQLGGEQGRGSRSHKNDRTKIETHCDFKLA